MRYLLELEVACSPWFLLSESCISLDSSSCLRQPFDLHVLLIPLCLVPINIIAQHLCCAISNHIPIDFFLTLSWLVFSSSVVLNQGWFLSPLPKEHLAMSGDILDATAEWRLLQTSGGYRPETLLNILQCTGQLLQQRIVRSKMSTVLAFRNSHITIFNSASAGTKYVHLHVNGMQHRTT